MLTAYFDDSGKRLDTKAVVLSGFVGTVDQWELFERDWRVVLDRYDLEYFHMKELRAGKGRFAPFKDNLKLQAELLDRLIRTLRVRVSRSIAAVVMMDDYRRVNEEFHLDSKGSPMVMAGRTAITRLMEWRSRWYPDAPLNIVVDQGISDFGRISDETYAAYGLRLIPAKVSDIGALQGSDLFAWELHRSANKKVAGQLTYWSEMRKSLVSIMDRFGSRESEGVSWRVFEENGMRELCRVENLPRRVSVSLRTAHDEDRD